MTKPKFVSLTNYCEHPVEQMKQRSTAFYIDMQRRRTVRHFSDRPVPLGIIEDCIRAAATAPSGANFQPWHFVVVTDPVVKRAIRVASEGVEHEFYDTHAPEEWLEALAPLDTNKHKPFLETAPHLIVIFAQSYGMLPNKRKIKHYYVSESVGIATGMLITAIHQSGLAALTYTPNQMSFLNDILNRSPNERPFLILVVGYPATDAVVPDLRRKSLQEIATFI